jgi:cephalosporin hydroxylase
MTIPTFKQLAEVRAGFSAFPLFHQLGSLSDPLGPDKAVDFSLKYPAISPVQVRSELVEYARIVAELRPKTVLEIGTFRGGTLFIHSRLATSSATLISIDLPGSLPGRIWRWMHTPIFKRFTQKQQKLHLLRADSHDRGTLNTVSRLLNGQQLDLLFIDGDHSYGGVRADFEMYSPLVRPGGVIAFHDIAVRSLPIEVPIEVGQLWNEIKASYRHREILHNLGSDAMGIGVLNV